MRRNLRAGALELAADALEQLAEHAALLLRDAAADETYGTDPVHRSTATLPMPEQGDRLSGLARETAIRGGAVPPADGITEQDGLTEEEWEAMHVGR